MAEKKTKKEEVEILDPRLYELGFHVLPTIAEDSIPATIKVVHGIIEKAGGKVVSEGEPKMTELAYSMTRVISNKNHTFDSAYFGWVKFELDPAKLEGVNTELRLDENILRFLTISTTVSAPVAAETASPEEKKEDKELDKTIEDLVIE